MTEEPYVAVRDVKKSFGPVEVLHGINLDLVPGTITALLGENGAGKSTLVKILTGDYRADSGSVFMGGTDSTNLNIGQVRELGMRVISQEIADAPTLTVAENILLGSWPTKRGMVDRKAMDKIAKDALMRLGAELEVDRIVGRLSLGERQLVEIARSIVGESKCIAFDEPTAALSDIESRRLFKVIDGLKSSGVAVLYITHRLDEVFEIADRTVVLRDGRLILDEATTNLDTKTIVEAMVGRTVEVHHFNKGFNCADQEGGLFAENLSGDAFEQVDIVVPRGDIVCLYGKIGSGVTEITQTVFGALPRKTGTISIDGRNVALRSPAEAVSLGMGFLPADRKTDALLSIRSVGENIAAPSWPRLSRGGFIRKSDDAAAYMRWHKTLNVKSRNDPEQLISTLSGGNQQKILLGRWLEADSDVLILNEPTRGVDVGARQEIYHFLRSMADKGSAVLVATSDYEDVVAIADEAQVFIRGKRVAVIPEKEITIDELTTVAGGALND